MTDKFICFSTTKQTNLSVW